MVPVNSCRTALLSSVKSLAPCVAYKRPRRPYSACVLRLSFAAVPSIAPLFPRVCLAFRCPRPATVRSAEQGLSHYSICTAGGPGLGVYLKSQCSAVVQIIIT